MAKILSKIVFLLILFLKKIIIEAINFKKSHQNNFRIKWALKNNIQKVSRRYSLNKVLYKHQANQFKDQR